MFVRSGANEVFSNGLKYFTYSGRLYGPTFCLIEITSVLLHTFSNSNLKPPDNNLQVKIPLQLQIIMSFIKVKTPTEM